MARLPSGMRVVLVGRGDGRVVGRLEIAWWRLALMLAGAAARRLRGG